MKPLPHHYDVRLTGGPAGYGALSSAGLPELRMAPPLEFNGPGDAWSPEHLLLAAVGSCFLLTLRSVARASQMEFTWLELHAAGTVDRQDGVTRFSEIVLRPTLSVAPGTDHERVRRLMEKTEKACLVSASLATPIRLEPVITEQERG